MSVYASNSKIVIDLSKLSDYTDICDIMSSHIILNYVYEFCYNGETIKYGMSCDNSRNYGDRIYRQAGRLQGWKRQTLVGPNGSEMYFIDQDYLARTGVHLNRHGMVITVTDMTKQSKEDSDVLERYLIDTYINNHGQAPIGTKDKRTLFEVKKHINDKRLKDLFYEVS